MDFDEKASGDVKEISVNWEMEPGSESSQHQKRKPVTHGLEDQKRVSDKTSPVAFCA